MEEGSSHPGDSDVEEGEAVQWRVTCDLGAVLLCVEFAGMGRVQEAPERSRCRGPGQRRS